MTLLHTYSIVALDRIRNQIGVAVQSHWFGTGSLCPWIIPGVGAVATQSMVEVSYGPKGLELLRNGLSAQKALDRLLSEDAEKDLRQVAIVDADGNTAVHTGQRCIAEAGHQTGDGFSVQANMMLNDTVWPAMAEAFQKSTGDLSNRLIFTLKAAQNEGGDIRGMQSAALLVAENIKDKSPWKHIITNLRVDDHSEPLEELERLLDLNHAYTLMNEADTLISRNIHEAAREKYKIAARTAPEIEELIFWQAVSLADIGKVNEALPLFERVFKSNQNWAILIQRLPASGLLKADKDMMQKILSVTSTKGRS